MSCAEKLREIARKNRLFRRARIYVYTYTILLRASNFTASMRRIEFEHVSMETGKCNSLRDTLIENLTEKFRHMLSRQRDDLFKRDINITGANMIFGNFFRL